MKKDKGQRSKNLLKQQNIALRTHHAHTPIENVISEIHILCEVDKKMYHNNLSRIPNLDAKFYSIC